MADINKTSKRVLEPHERIIEVLFGLIMVVTLTATIRVALHDRENIYAVLIAAIGCNVAWGIIDGVFYLMACLSEKRRSQMVLREVLKSDDPQKAHGLIRGALPPLIASVLQPSEVETVRQRLRQLPKPLDRLRLSGRDWLGALGVCLLVVCSTFPVVLPFVFMQNATHAMRASRVITIFMLFIAGAVYGRQIGRSPWLVGAVLVGLGVVLIGLTMALGG